MGMRLKRFGNRRLPEMRFPFCHYPSGETLGYIINRIMAASQATNILS
jgi:hypothetical protein